MPNLFGENHDAATTTTGRFAQVAIEQGLDSPAGLTYAVPDELADLRIGDRVLVPLGRAGRTVDGYVLALADATDLPAEKIKPIASRERAVNLPDDLVDLARWIADYYCCPLGMVFATVLPAAVKKGTGLVQKNLIDLHSPVAADALPSIVKQHRLPPKQAAVLGKALELKLLHKLPIDALELATLSGSKSRSPVKQLVEKGLLKVVAKQQIRAIWAEHVHRDEPRVTLTGEQAVALDRMTGALGTGFGVQLLHGVTGSGKTEVYIRAIERVVAHNQTAIVLVPEIALTPQTAGRFLSRFERVAVLHSGLTAAQRHEQWQLIRDGYPQVIVGARSAIFAPTKSLGLIVVDEEHDNSYKQDQAPRYHGRDVAIKRAQMLDIPVVLGSATPSLESYYNATVRQTYELLELPNRVNDLPLPPVQVVDMLAERRQRSQQADGRRVHLLSRAMEQALRQTFDAEGQAILLLNRRGYANYVACPDHRCGWTMNCDHCDVTMVYHLDARVPAGGLTRCHYCGFENRLPTNCPLCNKKVMTFGLGTQRVEEELERKFPGVRMLRMDSDAMRTATDYENALRKFGEGKLDLLVGTQMIAKGLDFPNVRMVGVISADTALNLPDFRATERTFQLVAQVSGRSGRGLGGGRVVVQTFTPGHPAIERAADHDYRGFARAELAMRQEMNLPPASRMARVVCRDRDLDRALEAATQVADAFVQINDELQTGALVLGPLTPPIARLGGYFRMQIELIAADAAILQRILTEARRRQLIRSDARMAVDVDPVSLL